MSPLPCDSFRGDISPSYSACVTLRASATDKIIGREAQQQGKMSDNCVAMPSCDGRLGSRSLFKFPLPIPSSCPPLVFVSPFWCEGSREGFRRSPCRQCEVFPEFIRLVLDVFGILLPLRLVKG